MGTKREPAGFQVQPLKGSEAAGRKNRLHGIHRKRKKQNHPGVALDWSFADGS